MSTAVVDSHRISIMWRAVRTAKTSPASRGAFMDEVLTELRLWQRALCITAAPAPA
jgi:hypothetical protein